MKRKLSPKDFDLDYFKKFEINNSNRILGGASCTIDYCTYSADVVTPSGGSISNSQGYADDGGGTQDETTTVKGPSSTIGL